MAIEEFSGLDRSVFMTIEEARKFYGLEYRDSLFATELNQTLETDGIAAIPLAVNSSDFQRVIQAYEVCIEDCPDQLAKTYHQVDFRHGKDAGHVRKERTWHKGTQSGDAKNYFHFNEYASRRWAGQLRLGPIALREFLEMGADIQTELVDSAEHSFRELEETHPNITKAHFVGSGSRRITCSFLRILSYDGYCVDERMSDMVAKPHRDIGNATIQAYSDAPGFWVAPDGPGGEKHYYPGSENEAHLFMGAAHKKLYADKSPLKPLWHGVDRIVPAGATTVPKRHSIVLFIDTPYIDDAVRPEDTLPQIYGNNAVVA